MNRNAGFSFAASVSESHINSTLAAAIAAAGLDPLADKLLTFLPPEMAVPLLGTVKLAGHLLWDQRPTVELTPSPSNTIRITAGLDCIVAASLDAAPIDLSRTSRVRIEGTAEVLVEADVDVVSNGVFLAIDPSLSSITSISVVPLAGPPLPALVTAALSSQFVRDALERVLRLGGRRRITGKLFPAILEFKRPGEFPSTGFSEFDWIFIHEVVQRVVLVVQAGSVAVGIDLATRTAGDRSQLVDLFANPGTGPVYRWRTFDSTIASDRPILDRLKPSPRTADIALLVNSDILTKIVEGVSARIANTPVSPKVTLRGIAAKQLVYNKPMRGGEHAIEVTAVVDHSDFGPFTVRAYVQVYLLVDGEHGAPRFTPSWKLYIGTVDIPVPWWVDVVVIVPAIALAVSYPVLSPLLAIGVLTVLDGIIPGQIGNLENTGERALGQGVTIVSSSSETWETVPTPGWASRDVNRIHLNDDGLGVLLSMGFSPGDRLVTLDQSITVDRRNLDGSSRDPFSVELRIADQFQGVAPLLSVDVRVARSDTNATVASASGLFLNTQRLEWSHLSEDLYDVDLYQVTVLAWIGSSATTGLVASFTLPMAVTDVIDRHSPYVTWSGHTVHFKNAGTGGQVWSREVSPAIHRTAASARCLALRTRTRAMNHDRFDWIYPQLGFAWPDLELNRDNVCDYCFFGGPTKTQAFPEERWFSL